jgi:hypothetical protein
MSLPLTASIGDGIGAKRRLSITWSNKTGAGTATLTALRLFT